MHGSPDTVERHFWQSSIEALVQMGVGGVLVGAPDHVLPHPLPGDIIAASAAPFSQILPHCVLAVHHGGIGTTASVLRAGLPAVIVPRGFDQAFNAAQVVRHHLGRVIPLRRYNTRRAVSAMEHLRRTTEVQAETHTFAQRLAEEDGAIVLVNKIERFLSP